MAQLDLGRTEGSVPLHGAAASTRRHLWLRVDVLLAALAVLGALGGLALSWSRIWSWSPVVAWLAANALVFLRVEVAGVVVVPQYAAFAVAALAVSRVRLATPTARSFAGAAYAGSAAYSACVAWGLAKPVNDMLGGVWMALIAGCFILLLRPAAPRRRPLR